MIQSGHEASPEIEERSKIVLVHWNDLLEASANTARGLEEAKDILTFSEERDLVEAWIREKSMLVTAGETGKDYEHCLELQKKVNDAGAAVTVDEQRIKAIQELGNKIIKQGRTDIKQVQGSNQALLEKWQGLQGALVEHKEKLSAALEIHAFNRDGDEIIERIYEKALAFSTEDLGKDLPSVQALQRRHDELERDMTVLQSQIEKLESLGHHLSRKYPDQLGTINDKHQVVLDNWERLEDLSDARKSKLHDSYQLQKLKNDFGELVTWQTDMEVRMMSSELAKDVQGAEQMVQRHQEFKAEIDGRCPAFQQLKSQGEVLIARTHYASDQISAMVDNAGVLYMELIATCEQRKAELSQCYDLQVFNEYAEQADIWLTSKEAFLSNEDLGDTVAGVEALLKKHSGFEKSMQAQEDKIDALEGFAKELLDQGHYAAAQIMSRSESIIQRRAQIKMLAVARKHMLKDSMKYQYFLRRIYELETWLQEKLQIAQDEAYRDPTNLQGKTQKHQAFEAELGANLKRVETVQEEGQNMIDAGHFASVSIQEKLSEIEVAWREVLTACEEKRERLKDAYQAMLFNRTMDDFEEWLKDKEIHMASTDYGKDLTTVSNLLKKHQLVEQDIINHREKLGELEETIKSYEQTSHFMLEELRDRVEGLRTRYIMLEGPSQIRKDHLDQCHMLYQFYRDVEDEMSWIKEKKLVVSSTDLGDNLLAAQNLQKKHQALEGEILAHDQLIEVATGTAHHMITIDHFAVEDAQSYLHDLQTALQELKRLSQRRKKKLQDSLEVQMYFAEVAEAEIWISEKLPFLTSDEIGKDEDGVQVLLKKLDTLDLDIENYNTTIGTLSGRCIDLVSRGHYDSEVIQQKQAKLEEQYQSLHVMSSERRGKLQDNKQLFDFYHEADEVAAWIKEKEATASSEDYGRDLEHVELLQQKFTSFVQDLLSSEDRVVTINTLSQTLLALGHWEGPAIEKRCEEINQLWVDVKELANTRQEALSGAREVHTFDRDSDEAIEWMQEKEGVVNSEDYGHDVESVQSLLRHHEALEGDLAAISEKVHNNSTEAERLLALFPDAQAHVAAKHDEMVQCWNVLLDKTSVRKTRLQQAEQLQVYFNDYRELVAWCSEMMAVITADDLAHDIAGAESLLSRHKENKTEIDMHMDAFTRFKHTGQQMINDGHFLAEEIQEKMAHLDELLNNLLKTWHQRKDLYEQNLDVQHFKRDLEQLEAWLATRESSLQENITADSINAVEEMIKKHEDFEKTLFAQEEKFTAVNRITLLESAFQDQKKREERDKQIEEEQKVKDRREEIKRQTQERILQERRMDEKSQKTPKKDMDQVNGTTITITKDSASDAGSDHTPTSTPHKHKGGLRRADSWNSNESTPSKRSPYKREERRKRTPSFTTRRRTLSFQEKYQLPTELPPVEAEGVLERKQELQSGGKKAAVRSWKNYYTVLCGHLLCFFKDRQGFEESKALSSPVNLHSASCEVATDYKKKNVLRVVLADGSEYLFMTPTVEEISTWHAKITFVAALPPSKQLVHHQTETNSTPEKDKGTLGEDETKSMESSSPKTTHSTLDTNENSTTMPVKLTKPKEFESLHTHNAYPKTEQKEEQSPGQWTSQNGQNDHWSAHKKTGYDDVVGSVRPGLSATGQPHVHRLTENINSDQLTRDGSERHPISPRKSHYNSGSNISVNHSPQSSKENTQFNSSPGSKTKLGQFPNNGDQVSLNIEKTPSPKQVAKKQKASDHLIKASKNRPVSPYSPTKGKQLSFTKTPDSNMSPKSTSEKKSSPVFKARIENNILPCHTNNGKSKSYTPESPPPKKPDFMPEKVLTSSNGNLSPKAESESPNPGQLYKTVGHLQSFSQQPVQPVPSSAEKVSPQNKSSSPKSREESTAQNSPKFGKGTHSSTVSPQPPYKQETPNNMANSSLKSFSASNSPKHAAMNTKPVNTGDSSPLLLRGDKKSTKANMASALVPSAGSPSDSNQEEASVIAHVSLADKASKSSKRHGSPRKTMADKDTGEPNVQCGLVKSPTHSPRKSKMTSSLESQDDNNKFVISVEPAQSDDVLVPSTVDSGSTQMPPTGHPTSPVPRDANDMSPTELYRTIDEAFDEALAEAGDPLGESQTSLGNISIESMGSSLGYVTPLSSNRQESDRKDSNMENSYNRGNAYRYMIEGDSMDEAVRLALSDTLTGGEEEEEVNYGVPPEFSDTVPWDSSSQHSSQSEKSDSTLPPSVPASARPTSARSTRSENSEYGSTPPLPSLPPPAPVDSDEDEEDDEDDWPDIPEIPENTGTSGTISAKAAMAEDSTDSPHSSPRKQVLEQGTSKSPRKKTPAPQPPGRPPPYPTPPPPPHPAVIPSLGQGSGSMGEYPGAAAHPGAHKPLNKGESTSSTSPRMISVAPLEQGIDVTTAAVPLSPSNHTVAIKGLTDVSGTSSSEEPVVAKPAKEKKKSHKVFSNIFKRKK